MLETKTFILRAKEKLPTWDMIAPVFAVITVVIYGWTLYWFLYEIPGWLKYLKITEIFHLYLYMLMVNFFESLLVLFFIIALSSLLPKKWFRAEFIFRGTMLSLFGISYVIGLIVRRSQTMVFSTKIIHWFPIVLIAAYLLIIVLENIPFLKKSLESFADQATVFLYISIPGSLIATIIIMMRSVI